MLLWILFALMTAAVLAAVLAPLARPAGEPDQRGVGSLAVYRDQLEELEAERARGLIDPEEAAASKVEISRRLLAGAGPRGQVRPMRRVAERWHGRLAMLAAGLVPLVARALYLVHGSPGMTAFPAVAPSQIAAEHGHKIGSASARDEGKRAD